MVDPVINFAIKSLMALIMLTYLIGDNPLFKFGERAIVGVTVGYKLVQGLFTIFDDLWIPMLGGKWFYIITFILGILTYTQLSKRTQWITRYPIAIITGTYTGVIIRGSIGSQFVNQIIATMTLPLTTQNAFTNFSNLVLIVGTITSLSYFLFTKASSVGPMNYARKIGKYAIFAALGASFGMTAAYRQDMLIGRYSVIFPPEYKWVTVGIGAILSVIMVVLYKTGHVQKQQ